MTTGPESFHERLDAVADAVEAAETEDDLDKIDATLSEIGDDLEAATFEGEDLDEEAEDEDDDEDDPREELEDRISDLQDDADDQRGPYASDVADDLSGASGTVESSEWTETGLISVIEAVEATFETLSEDVSPDALSDDTEDDVFVLSVTAEDAGADGEADDETIATVSEALLMASDALESSSLDPDDDAETIATLLEATETLDSELDDAQVFGDLEVREQLRRLGFYDILTADKRKDFPPEWSAIKQYELRGEVEPMLLAMEMFDSDHFEENVLKALEHIAPEEAFDDVHALAQRRNLLPVRILGRIGDDRACDTLHNFLGGGDVELEQTSLQALGAIGSEESTEPVAERLVADNPEVRSSAARALGRIGDTRAIDPLVEVLEDDDAETVRASAAWALRQIGTRAALSSVAFFTGDRSYLVQAEAQEAAEALGEKTGPEMTA